MISGIPGMISGIPGIVSGSLEAGLGIIKNDFWRIGNELGKAAK
jgi:hypothetical protein